MKLTPYDVLLQVGHVLRHFLFPAVGTKVGPLSKPMQLVASVVLLVPLDGLATARRRWTVGRANDRAALATAVIARAVLHLSTTEL